VSRAYSGGVKLALESLPLDRKVERAMMEVEVGYPQVDGLQKLLAELDSRVEREQYGGRVLYEVAVPEALVPRLQRGIADLTAGEGRVRRL